MLNLVHEILFTSLSTLYLRGLLRIDCKVQRRCEREGKVQRLRRPGAIAGRACQYEYRWDCEKTELISA